MMNFKRFVVTIGTENKDETTKEYSFVTAIYDVEGVTGVSV